MKGKPSLGAPEAAMVQKSVPGWVSSDVGGKGVLEPSVVSRTFKLQYLTLTRSGCQEGTLEAEFELQRIGLGNSGNGQNSGNPNPLLRLKIEPRESQLLTSLLEREIQIEEVRQVDRNRIEQLESHLLSIREENSRLVSELKALRQYVQDSQRPLRSA